MVGPPRRRRPLKGPSQTQRAAILLEPKDSTLRSLYIRRPAYGLRSSLHVEQSVPGRRATCHLVDRQRQTRFRLPANSTFMLHTCTCSSCVPFIEVRRYQVYAVCDKMQSPFAICMSVPPIPGRMCTHLLRPRASRTPRERISCIDSPSIVPKTQPRCVSQQGRSSCVRIWH